MPSRLDCASSRPGRPGLLLLALLLGALTSIPVEGGGISGPSVLSSGERAVYRIEVSGDASREACDARLSVDLPPGFRLLRSYPSAAQVDRRRGRLVFPPIARLARGEERIFELELQAPTTAVAGALCTTLDYGACPAPEKRDLALGPVCASVAVLAPAGSSAPRARAAQTLRSVPCGTRPTVTPGGSTFDPMEWTDAASQSLNTTPGATLHAKTGGDDLFLLFRVLDGGAGPGDQAQIYIDVTNSGVVPTASDRSYLAPRSGPGTQFSGTGNWTAVLGGWGQFEVAELAGEWVVEMQIPLTALGGPRDPLQDVRIAAEIRDGGIGSLWPSGFLASDKTTMSRSDLNHCIPGACAFESWAQAPDALDPGTIQDPERLYDDLGGPNLTYALSGFNGGIESRSTRFYNGGSTGNVTQVQILLQFYVDASVSNDSLDLELWWNGSRIALNNISNGQLNTYLNSPGTFSFDVTFARAWTVADFDPSSDLDIRVAPRRNGSWDAVGLRIDAIGFRVQTDGTCQPPVLGGSADVFLTKDDGYATILAGQYLTYMILYGNQGTATATEVEIVDRIPPNTTYVRGGTGFVCPPSVACPPVEYSLTGVGWSTVEPANGTSPLWLRFRVPILPAGGPVTYPAAYQVRVDPFAAIGDRVVNEAAATLRQTDDVPASNSDWDDNANAGDNLGDEVGPFVFPSITIPCDFARPVVDGVLDIAVEYPNATVLTGFRDPGGSPERVTIYVAHDLTDLYVGFDVDDGENNNRDACYVVIDPNGNKIDPDVPDRQYDRDRGPQDWFFEGLGSNSDGNFWQTLAASAAQTARSERSSGWQAEFRIPFSDLAGISGQNEIVGIAFLNFSTSCGSCWANSPAFADLNNASSWTNAWLQPCAPRVSFSCTSVCLGGDTVCTDSSTNNPTSLSWDFGDGSPIQTGSTATHAYATAGVKTVTLTACNSNGCASGTMSPEVYGLPAPDFTATPGALCVAPGSQDITLDGTASTAGAGATISSYLFETDRGTLSGATTSIGTLSATLGDAGTASVKLTIADSHGCTLALTKPVRLNAPPVPSFSVSPAAMCSDPASPMVARLDATSSSFPSGSSAASWGWGVPPGHATAGATPVTDWTVPPGTTGLVTASLQLDDSYSCTGNTTGDLRLWVPPGARLVATPSRRCTDLADFVIGLDASGTLAGDGALDPAGYQWRTVGGGTLSGSSGALETLTVAASFSGTIQACVRARDGNACSHEVCVLVVIDPLPVPDFAVTLPRDCADDLNPIFVGLDASPSTSPAGIADPAGYRWSAVPNFLSAPDGRSNSLVIPAGWSGTVDVTLSVSDAATCSAGVSKRITIQPGPAPDVQPAPFERCTDPAADMVVSLDASLSSSPAGIADPAGYAWSVVLGTASLSTSSGRRADLTVPAGFAGIVRVRLEVTDAGGCRRETFRDYTFLALPSVPLVADRTDVCRDPSAPPPVNLDVLGASSPQGIADPAGFAWAASSGTLSRLDGRTSTLTPAPAFFGVIDVDVTVTDLKSCSAGARRSIVVHAGPTVVASVAPTEQCSDPLAPLVFGLDATASSSPEGLVDVVFSTSVPQARIQPAGFARASLIVDPGFVGIVPVLVTADDTPGCSATRTLDVAVLPRPVPAFRVSPLAACDVSGTGARFALDASASSSPSGLDPVRPFRWTASAGSVVPNGPGGRLATLIAPVGYAGPLDIELEVRDERGCIEVLRQSVTVRSAPVARLTPPAGAPLAMCSSPAGVNLALDGSRSTGESPIADPAGYAWSVVPATVGLSQSGGPATVLQIPAGFAGSIDVTLRVTDALGCSDEDRLHLDIWAEPTPRLVAVPPACSNGGLVDIPLDASPSTAAAPIADPAGYQWTSTGGTLDSSTGRTNVLHLDPLLATSADVTLTLIDANGCTSRLTETYSVFPQPSVRVQASRPAACTGAAGASFDLTALPGNAAGSPSVAWSAVPAAGSFSPPGGLSTTFTANPGFTGSIAVTATLADGNGCTATDTLSLLVHPLPAAAIAATPDSSCLSAQVALEGGASRAVPPATLTAWQFQASGPATLTGSGASALASYPALSSGSFTASLRVTDSNGCQDLASVGFTLSVPPAPVARLDTGTGSACGGSQPAVVSLDGTRSTASAPATIAGWSFSATGPASVTSAGPTAQATYPAGTAGSFQATLTVTDSLGCTATDIQPVVLRNDTPPVARLSASRSDVCLAAGSGSEVDLDASGSSASPPATLVDPGSFSWWASAGTLVGSGARVKLSLPAGTLGTITVRVTVTDTAGCRDQAELDLAARPAPEALASSYPERACEGPLGARFLLRSAGSRSFFPGDPTLSYRWSAPGETLTAPAAADTDLVALPRGVSRAVAATLVVADAGGCSSAPASVTVQVDPAPVPALLASAAPQGAPSRFSAAGSTGGTAPLAYTWDFGDGSPAAAGLDVTHVYSTAGAYTVRLTVSDAAGCSATRSIALQIESGLAGTLEAPSSCAATPLALLAAVSGGSPPLTFDWSFGDGARQRTTTGSTSHVYSAPGSYTVRLRVTDATGQSLDLEAEARVLAALTLVVSTSGPALVGVAQEFAARASAPASVTWTFSDGGTASGTSASHTFLVPGPAWARAEAVGAAGCVGSEQLAFDLAAGQTALQFAKSVAPAEVVAPAQVLYQLWVKSESGSALDVVIEDALPSGFEYVPGSLRRDGTPLGEPSGTRPLVFPRFSLAPGQSGLLTYQVQIRADVPAGAHDNSATLSATDAAGRVLYAGPRVASVRVGEAEPLPAGVDLRVIKRANPDPEPPAAGGLVHYRIEYENVGQAPASEVVLVDRWPADRSSVVDNGDGGLILGDRIEWSIGTLPGGSGGVVQYSLRLHPDLANGTPIHNVVLVSAAETDTHPADNRDSSDLAIGGLPDLRLGKTVATSPEAPGPGATATYTLSYSNAGAAARDVVIRDDYDESKLEIVGLPPGGAESGGTLRFALGELAAGQAGSLSYTARVREGASSAIENHAEIASSLSDANPADNQAAARFDVVSHPATLTLHGELTPARRCHQPQVEVALRSDLFDTAEAMSAAASFQRVAATLRGSALGAEPLLALSALPVLEARLESFARLNVESLLLSSGMGLPWAGEGREARLAAHAAAAGLAAAVAPAAPVSLPFASAHPVFAMNRSLDEPWCRHEAHRVTTPEAIGQTFSALAAYGDLALAGSDALARFRARLLLDAAAQAVATLESWRTRGVAGAEARALPSRILLGATGASIADSRSTLAGQAALLEGLARLLRVAGARPDAAPEGLAPAAARLVALLAGDLRAHLVGGTGVLADEGRVDAVSLLAVARALEALSSASLEQPEDLREALARSLAALETPGEGATAASIALDGQLRQPASLGAETAALLAWNALGEPGRADAIHARIERIYTEPRLRIYRSGGDAEAISYSPALLGAVLEALASRLAGASPAERGRLLERLSLSLEKVAVEAGLQVGLTGRVPDGEGLRLMLGASGDVKVSSVAADAPHTLAPVLVHRVSFLPQGTHHRDLSLVDAARGVREAGSSVHYLASNLGDCRTAEARLLDRRFLTESGLLLSDAMLQAAAALDLEGRRGDDALLSGFAAELRAAGTANVVNHSMLSGMGVGLGQADGIGDLDALLGRYAAQSGLAAAPAALFPTWLPLDGGDPVFPQPIDWRQPYAQGWERSRTLAGLGAAGLGQALLADVQLAGEGLRGNTPLGLYLARVRLHAAALKLELLDAELKRSPELGGFEPTIDAEGRVVDLGRRSSGSSPRGDAALLLGVRAYLDLVASSPLEGPPSAVEPARRVAELLARRVELQLEAGKIGDPVALYYISRALPASALQRRAHARAAAAGAAPPAEVSPMAAEALLLAAGARAGLSGEDLTLAWRAFRDRWLDRGWRLFRTGVAAPVEREGVAGAAFLVTDLDVAALLQALSAALPGLSRSDREEAADLIHAAGGRMLFESGLQRQYRIESRAGGSPLVGSAAAPGRVVRITVADSPIQAGTVYPGDLVAASFTIENPTDSSVADELKLEAGIGASLRYVPGSLRVEGKPGSEPVAGDTLGFALGRLGGTAKLEVSCLLRVDPAAAPGSYKTSTRARARSMPGAQGQPIETAPVGNTLTVDAFGALEGRVYLDADGDGRAGPGDPGMPEVTVALDDGTATVTDAEGAFRFSSLLPAGYTVKLLQESLPGPMSTVGSGEARVQVRPRETARAGFGLRAADVVTGIVYRDRNGNRRMDEGEPVAAGIVVETDAEHRSVTDRHGRYLIRGVATGSHVVRLGRKQPWTRDPTGLGIRPMAIPQATLSLQRSP